VTPLDRTLRTLEIVAVLAIAAILATWGTIWHHLRDRVAPSQPVPTTTATALLEVAELPGGQHQHVAATANRPTPALPVNFRPIVTAPALPTAVLATPAPQHATWITIPAIDVDAPVTHGVDPDSLQLGVGHYENSANPGERGNLVLAGHNDVYGEVFRYLSDLQPGDEVTVYTLSQTYRYVIRGWRIVEPSEVGVMDPSAEATLTLISCYPYLIDNQRIVVFGSLDSG
jgi:sortase A